METIDFHRLYEAYSKNVYRYSLYRCGNPTDTEEITMTVIVRALTAEPLLAIARRLATDERRRAARHERLEDTRRTPAIQ